MAKLPVVSPKKLIRALASGGFFFNTNGAATVITFIQTDQLKSLLFLYHNKDLKKGTLKSILRQAELSVDDLIKLL